MSKAGVEILKGLEEALAGNIARVTIEGQVWVRETPLHHAAPDLLSFAKQGLKRLEEGIADLGIREWTCNDCGTIHDRDVNAAKNILRLGLQSLTGGTNV